MRILILISFVFLFINSNAQNLIWKQYIDDANKDEDLTYLHTHKQNRYIFSSTENYIGSGVIRDYVISLTKTTLNGEILWTKTYRPGGENYRSFDLSTILFKDSIILIYSSCIDSFSFSRKYILELSLDGEERFAKLYPLRGNFAIHATLSDSNTINYVYDDGTLTKFSHFERFNKKHELVALDSGLVAHSTQAYRIHKDNIYTQRLIVSAQNKLGVQLYQYNSSFNLIDSATILSDITVYPSNIPLYVYSQYETVLKNNEMSFWGVFDFARSYADNFYIRINLDTKQLVESFNSRRITTENYTVNFTSSIHKEYKSNTYSIYKIYNKDSINQYKYRLVKFKQGYPIWNIDLKIPDTILISAASRSISMELRNDKLLAVINFRNTSNQLSELISEYDTNGNYMRAYADAIDTSCVSISSIQTIYNGPNEILTMAHGARKGRVDRDIIWKKTSFEPLGFENNSHGAINPPYPNPTNNILYLNCEVCSNIRVYDIYGKLVLEKSNTNIMELAPLSQGIYFVELSEQNTRRVYKVIKN
jgi:hypothetical protein